MSVHVNFAKASIRSIRVSPRKLNLVAAMVRSLNVTKALEQLEFSKKRIAADVKKCIVAAIANAQNNYGLDVANLVISHATVGASGCMKRMHPRARGKSAQIRKFFSNLYITVTQVLD